MRAVLLLSLLLAACVDDPVTPRACPAVTSWSAANETQLRKEYDALPQDALMRKAFGDYLAMRDAARACAAANVPGAHDPY